MSLECAKKIWGNKIEMRVKHDIFFHIFLTILSTIDELFEHSYRKRTCNGKPIWLSDFGCARKYVGNKNRNTQKTRSNNSKPGMKLIIQRYLLGAYILLYTFLFGQDIFFSRVMIIWPRSISKSCKISYSRGPDQIIKRCLKLILPLTSSYTHETFINW